MPPASPRTARRALAAALSVASLGACAAPGSPQASVTTVTMTPSPTAPSTGAASRSAVTTTSVSSSAVETPAAAPSPAPSTGARPATDPRDPAGCAARLASGLDERGRAGQLVMIGITRTGTGAAEGAIRRGRVGNVFFIGGWEGRDRIRDTADRVQGAVREGTPGIRALVAADQEGGKVQQLRGADFTRAPSAVDQAAMPAQERRAIATTMGRELAGVGVNIDLAPVADTLSAQLGRANGPIGRWDRAYGTDPAAVAGPVRDVVAGLHAGGVATSLKHFPGIGRIRANTDLSAEGITDPRTTADDPALDAFAAGIAAGSDTVMVSTARYPRIDPVQQAAFSREIVTGVLRGRLRYRGVVLTDDLGIAASVAAVPTGERAVRAVRAGADIVLTGRHADGPVMVDALVAAARRDPGLRAQVDQSVDRVLTLKVRRGLASCG